MNEPMSLFDFKENADLSNWSVVDDIVMGGRSNGNLSINKSGNGLFYGNVSLDNYGGFSSIRYRFEEKDISPYKTCKIRLKGDGKQYQFRVKTNYRDRHSYIIYFKTSGAWETIEVPLEEMYPSFRGMELNMPNYPKEQMAEISILISNKKAEKFELELDWINLE